MFQKNLKLATSLFVVLVALAASGSAIAAEHKAKVGDTVDVDDGDTIVVDASDDDATPAPKAKSVAAPQAQVKTQQAVTAPAVTKAPEEPPAPKIMADDFTAAKTDDQIDTDSVVELAVRGNLSPTGPTVGGTLGFSWRPVNRVRLNLAFTAGKGLIDMGGKDAEMAQFGFTASATRVMTRTVEVGAFGTVSWSYRDVVKQVSTSFVGIGPGFRLNKAGGTVFFEAALPLGWGKKFSDNPWGFGTALQASVGVHF